jgi:hypothetical protein
MQGSSGTGRTGRSTGDDGGVSGIMPESFRVTAMMQFLTPLTKSPYGIMASDGGLDTPAPPQTLTLKLEGCANQLWVIDHKVLSLTIDDHDGTKFPLIKFVPPECKATSDDEEKRAVVVATVPLCLAETVPSVVMPVHLDWLMSFLATHSQEPGLMTKPLPQTLLTPPPTFEPELKRHLRILRFTLQSQPGGKADAALMEEVLATHGLVGVVVLQLLANFLGCRSLVYLCACAFAAVCRDVPIKRDDGKPVLIDFLRAYCNHNAAPVPFVEEDPAYFPPAAAPQQ